MHYLSGPFEVEGAAPGDLLLVEIMDVQPFQDQPWGFTGIFAKENGGGFLDEFYPSPLGPLGPSTDKRGTDERIGPRQSGTLKASTAPHDTSLA